MKQIVLVLITLYQYTLSPVIHVVLGTTCRYEESCSRFAKRMIKQNGLPKGGAMALQRFLSCQPFGKIEK